MQGRTKVLYLITKSNFGGAQRYVFDMATHIDSERFDVVVAAGGSGILMEKLASAGIRTISIPHLDRDIAILSDILAFWGVVRLLAREKPAVLHLNSSKIGALGALAGLICRVPRIIFTAHGWAFKESRSFVAKMVIKTINWFTIALSHHTIAVSEQMKKEIVRWPFVASKTTVIHNGLAAEPLDRDVARQFLENRDGRLEAASPLIGTVAELHPIKGLSYAISAIAQLRKRGVHATFAIIGEGEELRTLERQISELHLEDRVFLLGFIADAGKYLKAFDLFTMPSLYEGLNFSVLEAGAAALPVVASRVGGLPEIITDGVTGLLVSPRDALGLANALQSLIEHTDDRARLGAALRERVARDFSLRTMVQETTALYAD
jgi:glycosyltransferase involved in cell wall biosynthesis